MTDWRPTIPGVATPNNICDGNNTVADRQEKTCSMRMHCGSRTATDKVGRLKTKLRPSICVLRQMANMAEEEVTDDDDATEGGADGELLQ